MNQHRNPEVNS